MALLSKKMLDELQTVSILKGKSQDIKDSSSGFPKKTLFKLGLAHSCI